MTVLVLNHMPIVCVLADISSTMLDENKGSVLEGNSVFLTAKGVIEV